MTLAVRWFGGALLFGLGVALGALAFGRETPEVLAPIRDAETEEMPTHRALNEPRAPTRRSRIASRAEADPDAGAERRDLEDGIALRDRAARFVAATRRALEPPPPDVGLGPVPRDPESVINRQLLRVQGAAQVISALPLAEQRKFARAIEASLCSDATDGVGILFGLKLAYYAPGAATQRGVDCVLDRWATEDHVLASALDVYRAAGFSPSASVDRWRATENVGIQRRLARLDGR